MTLEKLQENLGYRFRDESLLRGALYHSSYANEHRNENIVSNERLEFLGDAVLGFVSAEFLYSRFPNAPEGELTRIRAALVREESLFEVAQALQLGECLMLGKGEESGGGRQRPSILADCTEAVFAAVYLDGGMDCARDLIHRVLLSKGDITVAESRRRRSCRNWCSASPIRCCAMSWWVSRAPTMPRCSPWRCFSTARPWARAAVTARRRRSSPPPVQPWKS